MLCVYHTEIENLTSSTQRTFYSRQDVDSRRGHVFSAIEEVSTRSSSSMATVHGERHPPLSYISISIPTKTRESHTAIYFILSGRSLTLILISMYSVITITGSFETTRATEFLRCSLSVRDRPLTNLNRACCCGYQNANEF